MNSMQMRKSIVLPLWLALILTAIQIPLATAVQAHADYDRSVPSADEVIPQAPQQVQVWFTQELFRREGQNTLEVFGPDDQRVDLDDAAIDDDERKLMTVSLQSDLPNGDYTVRWRTLSADDGDDAEGEFQFTVLVEEPAEEVAPTATPTSEPAAAAGNAQPSPTNTTQAENAGAQSSAPARDSGSDDPESTPGQTDQGPGIPCLGSTVPGLFLLGAVLMARRSRRLGKQRSHDISRSLRETKK